MITTEQIVHTTNKGNFLNTRVYDFLTKMFTLVSATLSGFMQGQLAEFNKKKDRLFEKYARLERDPILPYNAERAKKVELLIAEDRFNQKLLRFNRLYGRYLNNPRLLDREQTIPECDTTWIYQDFPDHITEADCETLPATTLCEHILENYDLRGDLSVAKVIWEAEQEYRWFKAFSERRSYLPSPDPCKATRDTMNLLMFDESSNSSSHDFASLIEPDGITSIHKEIDFGPINDEINRLTLAQMGETDPLKQKEFEEELKRLHKFKDMALERRQDVIRKKRHRAEDNIKRPGQVTDITMNNEASSKTPATTTPLLEEPKDKISSTPKASKQAPPSKHRAAPSHVAKTTRVSGDDKGRSSSLSSRPVKYLDLSCYSDCIY